MSVDAEGWRRCESPQVSFGNDWVGWCRFVLIGWVIGVFDLFGVVGEWEWRRVVCGIAIVSECECDWGI